MTRSYESVHRSSASVAQSQSDIRGIAEQANDSTRKMPDILLRVPIINSAANAQNTAISEAKQEVSTSNDVNLGRTAGERKSTQPGQLHLQLRRSRWKSQAKVFGAIAGSVLLLYLTWQIFQPDGDTEAPTSEMMTQNEPPRIWRDESSPLFSTADETSEPVDPWGQSAPPFDVSKQGEFATQKNDQFNPSFTQPVMSEHPQTIPSSAGEIAGNWQKAPVNTTKQGQQFGSGSYPSSVEQPLNPYPNTSTPDGRYPSQADNRKPAVVADRSQTSSPTNSRIRQPEARLQGRIETPPLQ